MTDPDDAEGRDDLQGGIVAGLLASAAIVGAVVLLSYLFRYFWEAFHAGIR